MVFSKRSDSDSVFDETWLPTTTTSAIRHDLHIWAMSTTETALTAHVVVRPDCEYNLVLESLRKTMSDQFEIEHVTLQFEAESETRCPQDDEGAI